MKKRILALFLACMMIVSVIAVPAFAEEECAHEDVTYTPLKDGEVLPTKCTESAVCLWVCNDCGESAYKKLTGDHNMEVTYVEATCEEPAKAGEKCTYCGLESEMTKVGEALGHDWVPDFDNEDYKIPTCTEGGKIVNKCSRCNKVLTSDMAPSDHVWDFVDTVDATCEYGAGLLYRCLLCGDTMVEEFTGDVASPALNHSWVEGEEKEATCSEPGLTGFWYCEVCGTVDPERKGQETPKNENHTPVLVQTLKAATCTTNGVGKYACELCEEDLGYGVIAASHDWYVYSTTAPTCARDGKIVERCRKGCTTKVNNNTVAVERVTTLEKEDVECTWVVGTIEATCTTVEMYGTHCSVCGDHKAPGAEGSDVVVVGEEALGHDYVIHWNDIKDGSGKVIGVKPTCNVDGLFYVTCGRCDATWGSKATPINSANSTITYDAPDHVLDMTSGEYVDETCTTANGMKYLCTKCGEYKTIYFTSEDGDHFIGQKNHTWGEKSNKVATCYEKGYTGKQTCSVCGAVQYEKTPDETGLDPNNHGAHEYTIKVLKAATCTTNGVKQVGCTTSTCKSYVAYKVINAGHDYEEVTSETIAPECGKPGYKKSICSVCGHVKEEEPTLNHEYVALETANQFTVPATCHRPGKKATKICKHCGAFEEASLIDYTNAPAQLNHIFVKKIDCVLDDDGKAGGKVPVLPTCTETGWGYEACSLCGCYRNAHREEGDTTDYGTKEAPAVLSKDPHDYSAKEYVDATCTSVNGFKQICNDCGDVKFTAMTGEAAYGPVAHNYVALPDAPGNCWWDGYKNAEQCTVCGGYNQTKVTWLPKDPTNHVGSLVAVLKNPTCTTNGVGQYVCKNPACDGKVYFAAITAGHTWNEENLLVSESNNAIYIECDACDAVKVHEYLGEGDDVTGETLDSLKLNANVSISGAVSNSAAIVVKVSNVAGYSNIQIVVNGEVVTESTNANGVYTFVYKTAVSNMDDTFEVVVKGEKFGIVCTADVETFEFALLEDALSIIPVATTKIEDATASFVGRGVLIGETVKLLYHVKASETASVVLKKYGSNTVYATIDLADLTAVDGVYVIEVEVDAADWDQVFSASVVDAEGNVISNTNHYSVAQYAANNIKGTDKLSTVLSAMMQAIAD